MSEPCTLSEFLDWIAQSPYKSPRTTLLALENYQPTPLPIGLEPWGDRLYLAPRTTYTVIAHGVPRSAGPADVLIRQFHEAGEEPYLTLWNNSSVEELWIFGPDGSAVWANGGPF